MSLNPQTERLLVVNGINLNAGGGRVVLREIMAALAARLPPCWSVTAFVRHGDDLPASPGVTYRVPPLLGNSWTARLWFERIGLKKALKGERVDIFLSLQGAGAAIRADREFIYCHNSLPLGRMPLVQRLRYPKLALVRAVYDALYRYTIAKSSTIIVQQNWLRSAFFKTYGLRHSIVAYPVRVEAARSRTNLFADKQQRREIIYPLSAHAYKNAELACRAVVALEQATPDRYRLLLTIRGDENAYARWLRRHFASCQAICFGGELPHDELQDRYRQSHLLLFPSRTETWGLPITEAKAAGIGVIAADLPYAHETVGNYDAAAFVDLDDAEALAATIQGCWGSSSPLKRVGSPRPSEPYAATWGDLVDLILKS